MDAIELLMIQHEETKALFKKIEREEDDEKQDLFERVADALAVHATIEKQFYPATRNARTEEMLQDAEDMAEDLKAEGAPRESVPAETGSAAPLE